MKRLMWFLDEIFVWRALGFLLGFGMYLNVLPDPDVVPVSMYDYWAPGFLIFIAVVILMILGMVAEFMRDIWPKRFKLPEEQ